MALENPRVFEQPDEPAAREQLDRVIDGNRPRSRSADLLAEAEPDLLAHFTFPETIATGSAARTHSSG